MTVKLSSVALFPRHPHPNLPPSRGKEEEGMDSRVRGKGERGRGWSGGFFADPQNGREKKACHSEERRPGRDVRISLVKIDGFCIEILRRFAPQNDARVAKEAPRHPHPNLPPSRGKEEEGMDSRVRGKGERGRGWSGGFFADPQNGREKKACHSEERRPGRDVRISLVKIDGFCSEILRRFAPQNDARVAKEAPRHPHPNLPPSRGKEEEGMDSRVRGKGERGRGWSGGFFADPQNGREKKACHSEERRPGRDVRISLVKIDGFCSEILRRFAPQNDARVAKEAPRAPILTFPRRWGRKKGQAATFPHRGEGRGRRRRGCFLTQNFPADNFGLPLLWDAAFNLQEVWA